MFKKKDLNVPRPIHHDIKEQSFPDLSGMDLNLPSYNQVVAEIPKKEYYKKNEMHDYPKGYHKQEIFERYPKGYHKKEIFESPLMAKSSTRNVVRDNTLFVKIDKYKESMRTLNLIKESLMNTEHILNKLHQIKA